MAMEVLSPHAAGNHRALVSKETDDRGMLTRLARRARAAPLRGQGSSSGAPAREQAAGYAAIGFLISRPSTPPEPKCADDPGSGPSTGHWNG